MTARDVLSPFRLPSGASSGLPAVGADVPLVDVLPRLLDSPSRSLAVRSEGDGDLLGIITESSLLEGLGRMIAARDDSSVIIVECSPEEYSASAMAHAVEAADAHLVDLWSVPAPEGMLSVTLRVRASDPSAAVRSLERYDFRVTDAYGQQMRALDVAGERLQALQALLNV